MNNLYEALEICLYDIEQGADVDTVLLRYPKLADELRPILEASVKAKAMSVPAPSQEVVRRNRARLLQRASEMREVKSATASRRIWSVPLRRALVSLMVVTMLFVSSTGLVRASSNTLPGDNLYPVKRTWEDMLVLFTFDSTKRGELELEHEHERLDEVHELFAEGRSVNVDFVGYVTRQSATEWRVAGITIAISPDTLLPKQTVNVGAAVRVVGKVQNGMSILAERIELLTPGSIVPEVEDKEDTELETDDEGTEGLSQPSKEVPVTGSTLEAPVVSSVKTPTAVFEKEDVKFDGVVTSIKNNSIVINGVLMDIRSAEIKGTPSVGTVAKVEGYYDANGVFIVTKIEFKTGSSDGSGSDDGSVINNNSNDNGDDNSNTNTNENSNDDDSNDSGGHSGSGGGGDD